jgi:hypothetical protein
MRIKTASEQGSAIVAVVIVLFVGMIIGVSALQMAQHTNDATTVDRLRIQSVHAAEAGVNDAINRLGGNPSCDAAATAPQQMADAGGTLGQFQTRVDPEEGTNCADTLNRVINAWGSAPVDTDRTLRRLEVGVRLIPHEGFQFTLFASGPTGIVTVKNTGTVDGDIYAENLDQTQNNINSDSVITPGSIDTKNNAVYAGSLWAGGNVTLRQNGSVGESITAAGSSADGNVLLENGVTISRDVKAKGTVTMPTTYTIGGAVSQNNPNLPAPPDLDKPVFTWDPTNYDPVPTTFATAALLSAHLESIEGNLQGTFYTADTGRITMPRHATVTGPLTIVSNGPIDMGRSMTNSGGPWQVAVISLSTAADAINFDQPFTASTGLDILLYTLGGVDIKNAISFQGAVYADQIYLKNTATITRSESLASNPPKGFDFTQGSAARFTVVPVLWREIAPDGPPS